MDPVATLRELFPQVDHRIIRATVLDHGDDLDSAIEFITTEVLEPEAEVSIQLASPAISPASEFIQVESPLDDSVPFLNESNDDPAKISDDQNLMMAIAAVLNRTPTSQQELSDESQTCGGYLHEESASEATVSKENDYVDLLHQVLFEPSEVKSGTEKEQSNRYFYDCLSDSGDLQKLENTEVDLMIDELIELPSSKNQSERLADQYQPIEPDNTIGAGGLWKSAVSSSVHAVDSETIEQIVEQTRADKQTLLDLIQEVKELRHKADGAEAAAQEAKLQALNGGQAIYAKATEMREMLVRAREANAMHAGEVYGEKAILGTEAKELCARLQQVRMEKMKAFSVLEEIKGTLQNRIDTAREESRVADEERLSKESEAREALEIEESLMAKVAQESRELDAEAEACTKLREFLIARGSVVDSLQGEMAVICEDVELLKKKVEGLVISCGSEYITMARSLGGHESFHSTTAYNDNVTKYVWGDKKLKAFSDTPTDFGVLKNSSQFEDVGSASSSVTSPLRSDIEVDAKDVSSVMGSSATSSGSWQMLEPAD